MNDDLISRSALKKAISDATYYFEQIPIRVNTVQEIIDNAPTVCNDNYAMGYQDGVKKVLSERPTGEWIEYEDERWGGVWYTCSNCHHNASYEQDIYNNWRQKLSDFCSNCGAEMRGGRE